MSAARRRAGTFRSAFVAVMAFGLLLSTGPAAVAAPSEPAIPSPVSPTATDSQDADGTVQLTAPTSPASAYTSGALADPDTSQRVTWSVEPSSDQGPDGRVSFRHEVEPGAAVTDYVTVSNFADHDVTFALYASDGITTADGVFDLLTADAAPTDGGSWVTLEQSQVLVPAQSKVTVPFVIAVPANATPGDHPAGIVAALTTEGATDTDSGAVSMERRVGARVHLRVAGELQPVIEVQNLTADFSGQWGLTEGGSTAVQMDLVNTGNVRLQGDATLQITGPLGVWSRTIELGAVPEILPHNQIHVTATVDNVPPLIMLTHTATIKLAAVGADDIGETPAPAAADTRTSAMPWLWIVLLLGLIAVITYLVQSRGRARRALAVAVAQARADGERAASAEGGAGASEDAGAAALPLVAADSGPTDSGRSRPGQHR